MKTVLIFMLLVLSVPALAQEQASRAQAAKDELKKGERAFRGGHFNVAEDHFSRALELDSSDPRVAVLLARSIHRQIKAGSRTPENLAVGRRAVAAYERVLSHNSADDDAYHAIVSISLQMGDEEKVREMLWQRANNPLVPAKKRAETFLILATKQWQCSKAITERQENKETQEEQDGRKVVRYRMPEDATEFYKAKQCANDGLMQIEQAISLAPENSDAWSYKANLLHEMAKLAEMEGDEFSASQFEGARREADENAKRFTSSGTIGTNQPGSSNRAEGSPDTTHVDDLQSLIAPTNDNPAPQTVEDENGRSPSSANVEDSSGVVSAGDLNERAISKPAPLYPPIARAARADGTVTIQVLVDETGRVVTARAVSGHPLLQAASQEAALKAFFTPLTLSGRYVKMSGTITYNFVLD